MESVPRLATDGDLQAVEDIVRTAYARYAMRIGREPGPMQDDYRLLIEDRRVSVIEHDGSVAGIVVLIPQSDAMLLDNVAVAPAAQGLGLGSKLLTFAEQATVASGFSLIRLYTNEAMTENIALYARRGYAETHRAEEKGLRRVFMAKSLA